MKQVGLQLLHDGHTSTASHTVIHAVRTPGYDPDVLSRIAAEMLVTATLQGLHTQLLEVCMCVHVVNCGQPYSTVVNCGQPWSTIVAILHVSHHHAPSPSPPYPLSTLPPPPLPHISPLLPQVSDRLGGQRTVHPLLRAIVLQAHAQGGMEALVSLAGEGLKTQPHTLQVCVGDDG